MIASGGLVAVGVVVMAQTCFVALIHQLVVRVARAAVGSERSGGDDADGSGNAVVGGGVWCGVVVVVCVHVKGSVPLILLLVW